MTNAFCAAWVTNDNVLRMTAANRNKQQDEVAFVLHSYPFRETSLIIEAFSPSMDGWRLWRAARGAPDPACAAC